MNSNNTNPNDFPLYLFYQGKNSEGYKFFGAHPVEEGGEKKHRFRVWAPNAVSVSVVGDFNDWKEDEKQHQEENLAAIRQMPINTASRPAAARCS